MIRQETDHPIPERERGQQAAEAAHLGERCKFGRLVEPVEAGIAVGMKKARAALQQRLRVLAFAIRRVEIGHGGWRRAGPRPLIPDQDP